MRYRPQQYPLPENIDPNTLGEPIPPKHLTWQDILACSNKTVAIDTETTGLHWFRSDQYIIGAGFYCPEANVRGYMHIDTWEERRTFYEVIRQLRGGTHVFMHNAKFDLHFMGVNPEEVGWHIWDTSVMAHLIDSRPQHPKALAKLEKIWLGKDSKRQHVTQAPARTKIWDWSPNTRFDYGYNDTLITFQLAQALIPTVVSLGLWRVLQKEMNYLNVIWNAERHGIPIDFEYLEFSIAAQQEHWEDLEQQLWDACGQKFNWRSPQQLSHAIYQGLGIPKPKNPFADADGVDRSRFADAGLYKSTCTSSFLLNEKVKHPLGPLISALREAYRMWTTMKKYRELADDDGIVHANFKQIGTRTGRLSCSDPNLQNVPSQVRGRFTQSVFTGDTTRTAEYNLRNAFLARPGHELLSVDWKQMEMRMFGILSQDPNMVNALTAGMDIHAYIADKVWGVVDKTHREWSKTIGFGLIYGMTLGSLMFKLNQTIQQARKIRDEYVAEFPRIMPWMNEVIEEVQRTKMAKYWNGRIWREDDPTFAYKGANAMIQGGCAEILSVSAIRAHRWTREPGNSDINIVSFVHDEIMLEVPKERVREVSAVVGGIMEVRDLFGIPFLTDGKSGTNYGNQEKLSGKRSFERDPAELPETVSED